MVATGYLQWCEVTTMGYAITVERVFPSDCVENAGAVDAVVMVHDEHGNSVGSGEVTLKVSDDPRNGMLGAWGTREHWLSHGLRDLDDEALDAIVKAVRDAA